MWNDYQQNIIDNTYKKNYILEIFSTLNIFTHFLGIILLSSIGIFLYKNHITNLGELISVLILLTQSFYLINTFVEYLPQYFNFIRSTEKLSLIMAEQIENLKTKEITELVNGNLILNKIQLTDNKNNLILNNTNFEFNNGLPYLIQGENNFKKSLFLQTLFGKVELLNGTIKFDNYNINEIKTDSLNNFIHYLPTNSFVFDGTIKENLNLFASTNITDKQFSGYTDYKKLCHYLGFDEVIKKLPNQENTIINIKTDLLTQEELRLLNIIRVLVGNPRILLLEEPFNELSNFYKDKLINYLKEIASTKIVIISTEICVFEKQIVLNISNKNIQKKIENKIELNTTNGEENRALFKRLLKK